MKRMGAALLTSLALIAFGSPAAQARDAVVQSFDGTPILTHFFPAPGLEEGQRAPTLMIGHGWGGSGATSPQSEYAEAGYNVLTWDARGFGGSGGTVMIDHPEFEARDAQALIDFIAQQPEAQLDAAGDPRVGMDGPSYGGGIQFITAARDDRVDAIAPTIAWNTLPSSLYKNQSVKLGWDLALVGLGIPTSLLPGVFSPAGIQLGNQSPEFYDLVVSGTTTGRLSASGLQWLEEHGPAQFLPQIDIPTLIAQGTVDTLFPLDEAHRNFQVLKSQGVPVKMMWFCGGHGVCLTGSDSEDPISGGGRVTERKLAWFAKWLRGESVDTGPEFEWIDENGEWHESGAYPLAGAGSATASGSGTIQLVPGVNPSGALVFATESLAGLNIPIPDVPEGANVVGAPTLRLDYTGTGVSLASDGKTHIYAQLVDEQRSVVVNNIATPIPISLDGVRREIEIPLERIASLATGAGYTLQLIPQTTLYDAQRATGAVQVANAEITLPLGSPAATPIEPSESGGHATQGTAKKAKRCKKAKRKNKAKAKRKPKKRCKKGKPKKKR
jgi:ABC-2 type transport system ATP-binding protein